MIKEFLRYGLGMLYYELVLIALITLVQTLFLIFLHRGLITVVQGGLLDLDRKIGEAIKGILEGNIELPEQINPMQQIIMSMIQDKLKPKDPDMQVLRDENGKFK